MKNYKSYAIGSALVIAAGFSLPAAAQSTVYNYGNGGNCDISGSPASISCTPTTNNTLTTKAYAAAISTGSNYVAASLTDQGGSGFGMTSAGENGTSPNHAIDNQINQELVLLNFGTNKVVLTDVKLGWAQGDADVALLRWTGAGDPTMTSYKTSNLIASGWALVASGDLDGTNSTNTATTYTSAQLSTLTNGAALTGSNSSSWWIVSSYFGGGSLGSKDSMNDYFKLLSVGATCVSNTTGGACNTIPRGETPEPASLALAGAALLAMSAVRRRRQRK